MPLINGMKMACEPCIRGHRSTKCTHANERLMVPVRKPGRPLSACPHSRDQPCGCGSVTAAIPRKQACHCNTPTPNATQPVVPRPPNSSSETPSPTRMSFKVQKSSRPPSSRKQSFDPSNLERMDRSQINIQPFEQGPQIVPMAFTNGYTVANPAQAYGFTPQYANIKPQYNMVAIEPHQHHNGMNGADTHSHQANGYSNGKHPHNGLEHVIESPLATPVTFGSGDSGKLANGQLHLDTSKSSPNGEASASNGRSCCCPRQKRNSHSSVLSSISEPRETQGGGCCSSKPDAPKSKQESMSNSTSAHITPQISHQILPPNGMPFNPALYQQFLPQPTLFTYPSTYGSWQNPLQPSAWRHGLRASYLPVLPLGPPPFQAPLVPETLDTVHSCSCGDTCQCIGCAAHPYNDATQDYVRSAWASMSLERPSNEVYTNGHPPINGETNGNSPPQAQNVDPVVSPTAHTPSSTTSGNGDDQNLAAENFLFVSYPFIGEGCGGEAQSCPCGDDCECVGCTIHGNNSIYMPCCGVKDECPCGDDCQCIGCEIHKVNSDN